jgi:glucosamine kinase
MQYILGFDGGGTKTECVLLDAAGNIVARTIGGPANPVRVGVAAAVRAVELAAMVSLTTAHIERRDVAAVGAGLAGVGASEMREKMRAALQIVFAGIAITLFTDLEAALAAVGEGPAVVLVAGTGSAAIGRDTTGKIFRSGGYGPAHSDEGSAYDIGRRAIAQAIKVKDQTGRESTLGSRILAQLGCADWQEVQDRAKIFPDGVFPGLFPVIAAAADAGDQAAREILQQAAWELTALADSVANHIVAAGKTFLLAKAGGMTGRSVFFDTQLDAALQKAMPRARLGALQMSPAEAAARAARY